MASGRGDPTHALHEVEDYALTRENHTRIVADDCRRLAREGKALYIACGPAGVGGEGKNGPTDQIGKGRLRVTVPHKLWKVVLVLPSANAETARNSRSVSLA